MIKIRIKNGDHEIDIRFPISESELYAKLAEVHAIEGRDAPQSAFVTEVYWPEEFFMLKDRFANLDELNYLARRMESFDYNEYDQFLVGITKLENPTEKDLINLTFNLDHFTLCKDVSSYGTIGRTYVLNTESSIPTYDEDDPKYAAIGKNLIDRGLTQITAKGLLIYNPFDGLTEVYNGQTFPEYFYENTLASAEVSYNSRAELLLLPGEEIAIKKALARLGAPSDSDCEIGFYLNQGENGAWEKRIEGIIRSEGLYKTNNMSNQLLGQGKTAASIDELYLFLTNMTAIEYIRNAMKRVRKKDSSIILASQNIEDFLIPSIREFTKPLFSIPTHQFLFNAGQINPKEYMDALQVEPSEFELIKYPERGTCLFRCGNERYLLQVIAPDYKAALFGKAGGR